MLRWIFLLFVIHVEGIHVIKTSNQTSAQGHKKAIGGCPAAAPARSGIADGDAFGNDFDACMINRWTGNTAAGVPVLKTSPTASCSSKTHARLCYGIDLPARRPNNAQYISCYNTARLIPEFTAHAVTYSTTILPAYKRPKFSEDKGPCAPNPQSVAKDCSKPPGTTGNYYCSRGHLTPSAAFDTKDERDLTFKMTNVAPQWQEFNGGNWAAVENAIKTYVQTKKTDLYVFTGTAGISKYWQWGLRWTFTAPTVKTVVPSYYWKAVCDPVAKQSIFFTAQNNVNDASKDKVDSASCFNMKMTKERGVIECESISQAAGRYIRNWWHGFVVPDFHPVNCGTDTKGAFLQPHLKFT